LEEVIPRAVEYGDAVPAPESAAQPLGRHHATDAAPDDHDLSHMDPPRRR
jgi:hypothetical protein